MSFHDPLLAEEEQEEKKPKISKRFDPEEQREPRHLKECREATEFLTDLGIMDDSNMQALLDVGFKSKDSFLARLPLLDKGMRISTLRELRSDMGRLDYRILIQYLGSKGIDCGEDGSR